MNRGVLLGAAAYAMWGAFPLYWAMIRHVPTAQAMGHRIVWSCVVLAMLVGASRRRAANLSGLTRRVVVLYSIAAILIGVNWTLYVWAVNAGFVVQTALGYFITPLVNVLLGVAVLRESLRRLQWIAVAIAAAGVLHLTRVYGEPPWIALGLAASFGTYGLIKKQAPLAAVEGLFLETAVLVLPALAYLGILQQQGTGVFLRVGAATDALLIGTGALTVVPLLLFATAVRLVPLSVIGILQFIAPTMAFLLGVFFFREPFSPAQLGGFVLVWCALILFAIDGMMTRARAVVLDEGVA
jgi:chloramphenicol-sensitive protein RarD